jgi:predicted alpha/beta-fold hydrolase
MTLWPRLFRRQLPLPGARRERWPTADGDEVELVRLAAPGGAPRFLLLHGLEGSRHSHYVAPLLLAARNAGWCANLFLFRSCNGELNRQLRSYHSGETSDLDMVVQRLAAEDPGAPLGIVGISLGGNVLLKWLGEQGVHAAQVARAAVAVSVPYDLARSARHLGRGLSRLYEQYFLRSLVKKALAKLERFPEVGLRPGVTRARSLVEFDEAFTAPVHGFRSAQDYYERSSSLGYLGRIRVPTLLLGARDDPFYPGELLNQVEAEASQNPFLRTEFHCRGGHVGFVSGRWPWQPSYYLDRRVIEFLARELET